MFDIKPIEQVIQNEVKKISDQFFLCLQHLTMVWLFTGSMLRLYCNEVLWKSKII